MFPKLGALLSVLALSASSLAACQRGLPWATDNRFAGAISAMPKITWFHHWADGPVPQMNGKVEYVPMFWGPSQWGKWNTRVGEMNAKLPHSLMAFNEPDISSQSNMDPNYAAQLYMEQIFPWARKGVKVGTPAIAYNLDWMNTFLTAVYKKGGYADFMCVHWYGSWNDLNGFKNFVTAAHKRFNLGIWVTEMGITTGSNPSQYQVKSFMMNAFAWMDTQSFVKRAAWFGAYESNKPIDGFATGKNALLSPGGGIGDMGYWYGYSSNPTKRSVHARHHIARDEDSSTTPEVDCDNLCELRKEQVEEVEKWAASLATREAEAQSVE